MQERKQLKLNECLLEPPHVKTTMHDFARCKDCDKCGWNKNVAEQRKDEEPNWLKRKND